MSDEFIATVQYGDFKGTIAIDGRAVGDDERARTRMRRRSIGFVFQRFNLLGVLSGRDNVRMSLSVRGLRDDERIEALLARRDKIVEYFDRQIGARGEASVLFDAARP